MDAKEDRVPGLGAAGMGMGLLAFCSQRASCHEEANRWGKARVLRIANAALKGRSSTVMHTLSREPSLSISTKLLGTAAVTADT